MATVPRKSTVSNSPPAAVSEDNIEFLKEEGRRYILGANKTHLKKFEQQLLEEDWHTVHAGVEVIRKRCVTKPTDHQAILLHHLGLTLPASLKQIKETS